MVKLSLFTNTTQTKQPKCALCTVLLGLLRDSLYRVRVLPDFFYRHLYVSDSKRKKRMLDADETDTTCILSCMALTGTGSTEFRWKLSQTESRGLTSDVG